MLDRLIELDKQLFLYFNSKNNPFFDGIMYWLTDKLF